MTDPARILINKRAGIKGARTRYKNFIQNVTPESRFLTHEIIARREKLPELYAQFSDVQSEIETLEEEKLPTATSQIEIDNMRVSHATQRDDFERVYFEAIALYDAHIQMNARTFATQSNVNTNPINSNTSAPQSVASQHIASRQDFSVRLPKLELKAFSGEYHEWRPFRDYYVTTIHSNPAIPVIHKFQYLKSCLKGSAAEVIESLELTDANYNEAWDMLAERFENTRWIVQGHVRAIFDLRASSKENHKELRELLDGVLKHLRALKALQRPTETWDDLIIHIITSKLDSVTAKEWEKSLTDRNVPTLKTLITFLQQRVQVLEVIANKGDSKFIAMNKHQLNKNKTVSAHASSSSKDCDVCKQNHFLFQCDDFRAKPVETRAQIVDKLGLCRNCLRSKHHKANQCPSTSCRKCQRRHNTLLHFTRSDNADVEPESSDKSDNKSANALASHIASNNVHNTQNVLLSTVVIKIFDVTGKEHLCRVLLDNGSQLNFITTSLKNKLQLPEEHHNASITGIGKGITHATRMVTARIGSRINKFSETIICIVLTKVTNKLPQASVSLSNIHVPTNIILADEHFNKSSNIDLIIGAEIFWQLIRVGQIKTAKNQPTFQKTVFGWIVSGVTANTYSKQNKRFECYLAVHDDLNASLKRFWEIEHGLADSYSSPEERECEEHYAASVQRNHDGRFIVELPTKLGVLARLGETEPLALKLFNTLEKRLDRQPQIAKQYADFMSEYENLGHMREISDECLSSKDPAYYMPHHCVLKDSSATTKLRVVFNASAKSSTGISLNDALKIGPILQGDLISRLLEFRTYEYAFTGDITKMYRQIIVTPSQTKLQRILWRESSDQPIRTYELVTVTYGTASASFLAIRCIRKLAEDYRVQYSLGSHVILNHFYVDDVLSGSQSLEEAQNMKRECIELLQQGGFELRKWASNAPELRDEPINIKPFSENNEHSSADTRTLGIVWDPSVDIFKITSVMHVSRTESVSKRSVLSRISLLFDPLGLLGPVVLSAKVLMQELWRLGVEWDESLPSDLHNKWKSYEEQLPMLQNILIPRKVYAHKDPTHVQIHGFCDASEIAYGACLYVRTSLSDGMHEARLWCSKSRVAPLKSISIPKLELCGALLLAKLLQKVLPLANRNINNIFLWSDSKIVLCWLKSYSRKWNTFVANRIGEIQSLTSIEMWRHVSGKENPADVLSRGLMPEAIQASAIWWTGPPWLVQPESEWPKTFTLDEKELKLPERKSSSHISALATEKLPFSIFAKYSSLHNLLRVTVYCLRFIHKCRNKKLTFETNLTADEMRQASNALLKNVQSFAFSNDIKSLIKKGIVDKNSPILKLSPFLDDDGILRVGGRLKNSSLPYATKHPALLPGNHDFTKLIIISEHERLNHAGAYQTLSNIRQKYWPCSGRNIVRQLLRRCVTCFKSAPKIKPPFMGELPNARVEVPSQPFNNCGVDFAGPLYYREGTRGRFKSIKCYLAIFVCFASKAIHIELAGDLSAETFLNVLKRFISRRGRPSNLYSDNGLNFVGCNHELHDLYNMFRENEQGNKIFNFITNEQMSWHFIPPHAPHYGGLWEAAVKCAKRSLFRILGDACVRYDELFTLVTQVEAILNSRPLTKLSEDPNDLQPLTPAHFLIGCPLTSFPEPSLLHLHVQRLSRWQRIEQLRQNFWKRWKKEYLHTLQERLKWNDHPASARVGQLIILKQPDTPVLSWLIGIIEAVHPGTDGVVRAVTIRVHEKTYKRPVTEICLLPSEDD